MDPATDTPPEALRARMVELILTSQRLTPTVEAALRHVDATATSPTHLSLTPTTSRPFITHTFADGTHLSCASGPTIVAAMRDALQV